MGTSQSSLGPNGQSPLVPPWADDEPLQPVVPLEPARFKPFRQSFGSYIKGRDPDKLKSALKHYSRKGTGGYKIASRRMGSVTKAGGMLYGALTSGSFGDVDGNQIRLDQLNGMSCDSAITRITEALSSEDGDSEKIRIAMNYALSEALDGLIVFDSNSITEDVICNTLIFYMTESIFLQITLDAGNAWKKAETRLQEMNAENALREVIKVIVDKNMASSLTVQSSTFTSDQIIQIEKNTIKEVWNEWSNYK